MKRDHPGAEAEGRGEAAHRYTKAFVSYVSKDRQAVLRGVQLLRAVGIDCFQDVLELDPGDRWERRLSSSIEESDLFLLFWSRAAHDSEWVKKEVLHALSVKRSESDPPEIKPVVLERPPAEPCADTMQIKTVVPTLADLAVPISSLRAHPRNPRRGDLEAVKDSLRHHGQ